MDLNARHFDGPKKRHAQKSNKNLQDVGSTIRRMGGCGCRDALHAVFVKKTVALEQVIEWYVIGQCAASRVRRFRVSNPLQRSQAYRFRQCFVKHETERM